MIFPLFSLHFSLDNFHWHIYQATFEMAEEILYCWYQDFTSIILTWSFLINFSFCLSTHLLYVLSTFSSKSLNIIMVSLSPRQVFLNYGMYWIIYLIISQSLFYLTLFIILMRLNFLQVTASVCSIQSTVFTCFLCGSAGKESTCNAGDLGSIPGLGRCPGEGEVYPLQYTGLENSKDCIIHGVAKSWTWLSNFHLLCWHKMWLKKNYIYI